mgnify:CR=1 FL=1
MEPFGLFLLLIILLNIVKGAAGISGSGRTGPSHPALPAEEDGGAPDTPPFPDAMPESTRPRLSADPATDPLDPRNPERTDPAFSFLPTNIHHDTAMDSTSSHSLFGDDGPGIGSGTGSSLFDD